jgi:hypothetical protein
MDGTKHKVKKKLRVPDITSKNDDMGSIFENILETRV